MVFKNKKHVFFLITILFAIGCAIWYGNALWKKYKIEKLEAQIPIEYLQALSPSQQAGQLFHIGIHGQTITKNLEAYLKKICPGGIILFKRNLKNQEQIKKLTKRLQHISNKYCLNPLLISIDQEGGRIQRINTNSKIPSALSIGQTQNPDYAKYAAIITGIEMSNLGINLVLAPVLDVNNNFKNPVINTRSFGSDPELVSRFGVAYVAGALSVHSGPVIKHFPGHGDTDTDSHYFLPTIKHGLKKLEKTELLPFKKALFAGAEIVMIAHILFPALDKKYPATLSKKITTGLLRQKLGFQGLIMTDALEMKAVADKFKQNRVARLALQAGADILLFADPNARTMEKIHSEFYIHSKSTPNQKERNIFAPLIKKANKRQLLYKLKHGFLKINENLPVALNKTIQQYNKLNDFNNQKKYKSLPKKYVKNFNLLSQDICKDSITTLSKDFLPASPKKALFYFKNSTMKKHGEILKLKKESIKTGHLSALSRYLHIHSKKKRYANKKSESHKSSLYSKKNTKETASSAISYIFIEIDQMNLSGWNKLVKKYQKLHSLNVIALYSGNPWRKIQTQKNFRVILNTTIGSICKPALLYRVLKNNSYPLIHKNMLIRDSK